MTESEDDTLLTRLVSFTRVLREAGLVIGTERVVAYSRAAAALGTSDLNDIYWAGRLTLIGRQEDLSIYDRAFPDCFLGERSVRATRTKPIKLKLKLKVEGELPGRGRQDPGGDFREEGGPPQELVLTAASPAEVLRRRSFEEYSEQEHALARSIMARLASRKPRRLSRRTRPARRRGSRPDLARTFRRALRTEGELLERSWRRRRTPTLAASPSSPTLPYEPAAKWRRSHSAHG